MKLLDQRNERIVAGAVKAIGEMGPDAKDAVPALVKVLSGENRVFGDGAFDVRVALVMAFGKIGEPTVTPLIDLLRDAEPKNNAFLMNEVACCMGEGRNRPGGQGGGAGGRYHRETGGQGYQKYL